MPVARNNAKAAATEDARDNKVLQRHGMPLTLDKKDVKEDKATAAAPEQSTEADRDTTDYTAVDKGKVTSTRVFLRLKSTASDWQMENLTQILAILSPGEASDTVPGPERASVSISAKERPMVPQANKSWFVSLEKAVLRLLVLVVMLIR